MKIILGSDKSGFYLKEAVKDFLNANGYDVIETGTVTPEKGIPFYEVDVYKRQRILYRAKFPL